MDKLADRLIKFDGYCWFQPPPLEDAGFLEPPSAAQVEHRTFSIGDTVMVTERMMRNVNKEGGLGRIVGFNARDGTYGVKYLLRSNSGEDGISAQYITPVDAGGSSPEGRRSKRSRVEAKEVYDPSKEAARPQFSTNKAESPTKALPAPEPVAVDAAAAAAGQGDEVDPDDVACMICGKSDNDELLVLCDGCEHGCHTFCCKPQLAAVPEDDWYCTVCRPPQIDLSGPLDLTLVKRKIEARAYAQEGTREQELAGLERPQVFPDWEKIVADVASICDPVIANGPMFPSPQKPRAGVPPNQATQHATAPRNPPRDGISGELSESDCV